VPIKLQYNNTITISYMTTIYPHIIKYLSTSNFSKRAVLHWFTVLVSLMNTIRVVKSRRIGRAGRMEMHKNDVGLNIWRRATALEGLGVDRTIVLRWILMKWDQKLWTGFVPLRIGTSTGV
jgi:hypothetical protein